MQNARRGESLATEPRVIPRRAEALGTREPFTQHAINSQQKVWPEEVAVAASSNKPLKTFRGRTSSSVKRLWTEAVCLRLPTLQLHGCLPYLVGTLRISDFGQGKKPSGHKRHHIALDLLFKLKEEMNPGLNVPNISVHLLII